MLGFGIKMAQPKPISETSWLQNSTSVGATACTPPPPSPVEDPSRGAVGPAVHRPQRRSLTFFVWTGQILEVCFDFHAELMLILDCPG